MPVPLNIEPIWPDPVDSDEGRIEFLAAIVAET
jgi:hypothetical protein